VARPASGWISTPDGRDGWATYFLRKGDAVYVVDQSGAAFRLINDVYGPTSTQSREYVMQRFTTVEKYISGRRRNCTTKWPGTAEPGHSAFDDYFASKFPG